MDVRTYPSIAGENGTGPKLRLCLAASGGGHVRQLLDLEPAWRAHDCVFVTEDTALGRSLAAKHAVHFVPHFAAGQARLGAPFRMVGAAIRNFARSAAIMRQTRPDVVITTGAGAVFFCLLWARLLGAKVIVIESFARFDRPSLFARFAAPLAHEMVVQSAALASVWPRARTFDPLRILNAPRPEKRPLMFATVGATLPFDRLVRSVADLKASGDIPEDLLIQTGEGGLRPPGATVMETLPFDDIQAVLRQADLVVCHGGTGSLITALREGCRVVAMPRSSKLGEHYDDHQRQITQAFAARGLIQVANTAEELPAALAAARSRPPVLATTAPDALINFLQGLLAALAADAAPGPVKTG